MDLPSLLACTVLSQPPSGGWTQFEASAYVADCRGCSGVTAIGLTADPTDCIIAVDPNVLALGSRYRIRLSDGTELVMLAGDVGGSVRGATLDVLVGSEREAFAWGRRRVSVKLEKE